MYLAFLLDYLYYLSKFLRLHFLQEIVEVFSFNKYICNFYRFALDDVCIIVNFQQLAGKYSTFKTFLLNLYFPNNTEIFNLVGIIYL